MITDFIINALLKLKATGETGFEGIVRQTLQQWTGKEYYLAKSGSQMGRDGSTAGSNDIYDSFEAKRYNYSTSLKERDILGGLIDHLICHKYLDTWALVTTRDVPDQLANKIIALGKKECFKPIILHNAKNSLKLQVFFCHYQDIFKNFLINYSDINHRELDKSIDKVKQACDYEILVSALNRDLNTDHFSYLEVKKTCRQKQLTAFCNRDSSRYEFGQIINLLKSDRSPNYIVRQKLFSSLDLYLRQFPKMGNLIPLIADEGLGKTWATGAWIAHQFLNNPSFPLCLFITHNNLTGERLEDILANRLSELTGKNSTFWVRKLDQWMRESTPNKPRLILVLDGLNERKDVKWGHILSGLLSPQWSDKIFTVITCRKSYWSSRLKNQFDSSLPVIEVPEYSDQELTEALKIRKTTLSSVPESLHELLRKPRFFDLVLKLKDKFSDQRKITLDDLYFEDWKDRYARKTDQKITAGEFEEKIMHLAEAFQSSRKMEGLEKNIGLDERILQELIDSGVFEKTGTHILKNKIDSGRLTYALGMILAESISDNGEQNIEEHLAGWLEPHTDDDRKNDICLSALYFILRDQNSPFVSRLIIFRHLIFARNLTAEGEERLLVYGRKLPASCFILLEEIAYSEAIHKLAEKRLFCCILLESKEPDVKEMIITYTQKWLGVFSPIDNYWTKYYWSNKFKIIAKKLSLDLKKSLQINLFQKRNLQEVDEKVLGKFSQWAIFLISTFKDRSCFADAFLNWALTRALAAYPTEVEEINWLIKTSRTDIWPKMSTEVINWTQEKRTCKSHLFRRAAGYLLGQVGNEEARNLMKVIPKHIQHGFKRRLEHEKNPYESYFSLTKDQLIHCMDHEIIPFERFFDDLRRYAADPTLRIPKTIQRKLITKLRNFIKIAFLKEEDFSHQKHIFEEILSISYVCQAETTASLVSSLLWRARNLVGKNKWYLIREFSKHFLLFENKEVLNRLKKLHEDLCCDLHPEQRTHPNVIPIEHSIESTVFFYGCCLSLLLESSLILFIDDERFLHLGSFLSKSEVTIDKEELQLFTRLYLESSELKKIQIISLALQWENQEFLQAIGKNITGLIDEKNERLRVLGSLVLIHITKSLPLNQLFGQIEANQHDEAIKVRGFRNEDLLEYSNMIDKELQKLFHQSNDESYHPPYAEVHLPYAEKAREFYPRILEREELKTKDRTYEECIEDHFNQRNAYLQSTATICVICHGKVFDFKVLKKLYQLTPERVDKWCNQLLSCPVSPGKVLISSESFYRPLIRILLNENVDLGIELYDFLNGYKRSTIFYKEEKSKVDDSILMLFEAPDSGQINDARNKILTNAKSNQTFADIVFAAHFYKREHWLIDVISNKLASNLLFNQAVGITLLYLSDFNREQVKNLCSQLVIKNNWVRDVKDHFSRKYERKEWAQHWFKKFVREETRSLAWAAFHTFLSHVDQSFWNWGTKITEELVPGSVKENFFQINQSLISKNIENNQKKLKESFLHLSTLHLSIPKGFSMGLI